MFAHPAVAMGRKSRTIICLAALLASKPAQSAVFTAEAVRWRAYADKVPATEPPKPAAYPWKHDIVTTVFWVGESAAPGNPVPNDKSSWDADWQQNFGGYDDPRPQARRGCRPAQFIPKQNPFYVALPYNDVAGGRTKPEAAAVIPWFKAAFVREGESVCKGRWVAIRFGGKEAYAQWEDCGPFRTDHWEYVFGSGRPSPNANGGAGLDISPAVRDYLGMGGDDKADWRFAEVDEIPDGPWALYGANNRSAFARRNAAKLASLGAGRSAEKERD